VFCANFAGSILSECFWPFYTYFSNSSDVIS
jgi:hypothetical protein